MKKLFKKMKKGFTLFELTVVIVLLSIIAFFSVDFLIDSAGRASVANASNDIVQFFKKVQNQNQLYAIRGVTDDQQVYYGISFKRDNDGTSYYYSYKKTTNEILEVFYLPNNVFFSNLSPGQSIDLRFCADMDFTLPIPPYTSEGGLDYLCDESGVVCSELYEITVKSQTGGYEKKVFINTSKTQYNCKPEIYIREKTTINDDCFLARACINNDIYNTPCDFEGEIIDFCYILIDYGDGTCSCE